MGRAPCCDKANVKKGPWAPEEDVKLKEYIEQYGTGGNWIALPQKIGLKRCGKSCRLRWLNYLRPNIKHGGFSEEEDNIICSLYISIGSRWSIIAAQLPGRTDNDIKNYWNTRLKKKLLGRRKDSHQGCRMSHLSRGTKDSDSAEDNSYPNTMSSSALERLQLHMQLQNIQNPFSFYNNPALWPKMHPYGKKLLQDQCGLVPSPPTRSFQEGLHELPIVSIGLEPVHALTTNLKQVENPLNGFSSLESSNGFKIGQSSLDETSMPKPNSVQQFNVHSISNIQAELGELLNSKEACFRGNGSHQLGEFDCFKEMDGGKEGMIWWGTNDFDTKSSSSNSWDDTASVLQPEGLFLRPEGLFQDYVLSYDLYSNVRSE